MKNKIKTALLITTIVATSIFATACGAAAQEATGDVAVEETTAAEAEEATEETTEETTEEVADETSEVTKITVATSGAPKPFTYVDETEELVGYDIEVAKAVFAKLPQYEVSFEVTEFASVLAGLDSGLYQVGANNFALNEERQVKYIYTDPIFANQYVIAVNTENEDINSFADLAGKTTEVTAGVNYTTALENYNDANPDKAAVLTYTESELLPILQNVESGKFDFQLIDAAMLKIFEGEFGVKLKTITLSEEDSALISDSNYSYFLVSQGEEGEKLSADINTALAEVIADGTVSEISQKYFGNDYAPKK